MAAAGNLGAGILAADRVDPGSLYGRFRFSAIIQNIRYRYYLVNVPGGGACSAGYEGLYGNCSDMSPSLRRCCN